MCSYSEFLISPYAFIFKDTDFEDWRIPKVVVESYDAPGRIRGQKRGRKRGGKRENLKIMGTGTANIY